MAISIRTVQRAILREIEAQAFYRYASDLTDRDDVRALFLQLADLEADHVRELARRVSKSRLNHDFDTLGYIEEMETWVSGVLSTEDDKTARKGDIRAVLRLAKSREAEARDIYRELAQETNDRATRAFFEELSFAEQAHMNNIGKLEAALSVPDANRTSL